MKIAIALGMEIVVYTRTPLADEDHITYTDLETILKDLRLSVHSLPVDGKRVISSTGTP